MRWLVCAVLFGSAPALADAEPTAVHAQLRGTTVELTARFQVTTEGDSNIEIPLGSIVVGGTVEYNGRSHRLRLDTPEAIDNVFASLAERAPAAKRGSAVRVVSATNAVMIDALTMSSELTVELALEMPACFFRNARYVALPESWAKHSDAKPVAAPAGCSSNDEHWIAFPVAEPAAIGTLAGRLPLGARDVARVEIDLPRELMAVPPDLHTAIVIDSSRSMTGDEIEAQRAVVASYLQHVPPQSRVQVIAYARSATPLLASWLPAVTAAAQVDREIRSLAPRNGSNLDRAIDEAARWLAQTKSARRLIVISDERFPTRIEERIEGLADRLPSGTLAHVVALSSFGAGVSRTDDVGLAPLAKATEGIGVTAGLDDSGKLDAEVLVHPLGIDHVTITGAGWANLDTPLATCGETIATGSSCVWWGLGSPVAGPLTVSGFVWGHHVERLVRADPSRERSLARELSAAGQLADEDLTELVDRAAFAVNRAWSMIATWGGTGGYADRDGLGTWGTSGSCCDGGVSSDFGHGFGTGSVVRLDLKKQLAPAVEHCHAQDIALAIRVEITREEIVDVSVSVADDDLRACIEEAVWATSLQIANPPFHATTTASF